MLVPVILSGGAGTRLWPLSRELHPKQLLSLAAKQTMLQETAVRLEGLDAAAPLLVCNDAHRFLAAEQLRQLDIKPAAIAEMTKRINARLGPARGTMRDRGEITRFFDGMDLLEPGVVQPQFWRPAGSVPDAEVTAWCGVARKR